jgi:hypothetical protein
MTVSKATDRPPLTTAILDGFRDRLATLRTIRQWAANDAARLRDAEFLAEKAFQELSSKLDVASEDPNAAARLARGNGGFEGLAAAVVEAGRQVRGRGQTQGRVQWLGATILRGVRLRRIIPILIVASLAVLAIQRALPVILFPNHAARMNDFLQLGDALERYYRDAGHYPVSHNPEGQDWVGIGWGDGSENWIPELVPRYLSRLPRDPRDTTIKHAQYIYRSDGRDFKLIALNPEDCTITAFLKPWLSDKVRNRAACSAYGVWTQGGAPW